MFCAHILSPKMLSVGALVLVTGPVAVIMGLEVRATYTLEDETS